MNWALFLIAGFAIALFVREVAVIRKERAALRRTEAWPQFEETYISGLQSGISISETFSFAVDFQLPEVGRHLSDLVAEVDRGMPLVSALGRFKERVALEACDLFVEFVSLANRTGGQNLLDALTVHAQAVRFELASKGDIRARQNAILSVAKLGLLAPWVLVSVLSVNEQTRNSFSSPLGQTLLIAGFAISFIAYRLVVRAGRLTVFPRIFGGNLG